MKHSPDLLKSAVLYKIAATGLYMNLYDPRNEMAFTGVVPAKGHFTRFWGWDTAFQAMGLAEFDAEVAKESLTNLLHKCGKKPFESRK